MSKTETKQDGQKPPPPKAEEAPKPLHVRMLRFLFGHLGLFLLVAAVAAGGAVAYMRIERDTEALAYATKKVKALEVRDARSYIVSDLWHYGTNHTYQEWSNKVKADLELLEKFVIDSVENFKYDGTVDDWNTDWTFPKALLFTITIMTTIGYGHIAPKSRGGQIFTIPFAMVGTPLLLVFLANVGDSMASLFTWIYSRICCRWCRSRRYQSEQLPGKKKKRLADDVVGREDYMPTDLVQVPIVVNLVLIMFYLLLGAIIFNQWEDWDLSEAAYFSFVTLSTIGFGDYVPGNSFLDYKDGVAAGLKMGLTITYCILGMALISMCIQMMQEQLVSKVRWAAIEIGLMEDPGVEKRTVVYKKSRRGAVPETRFADDGNLRPPSSAKKPKKRRKKKTDEQRKEPEPDSRKNDDADDLEAMYHNMDDAKSTDALLKKRGSDEDDDLFDLA